MRIRYLENGLVSGLSSQETGFSYPQGSYNLSLAPTRYLAATWVLTLDPVTVLNASTPWAPPGPTAYNYSFWFPGLVFSSGTPIWWNVAFGPTGVATPSPSIVYTTGWLLTESLGQPPWDTYVGTPGE